MQYVISAAEMILPHLRQGNLVILESTSPPKTTEDLVKPILEKTGLKAGEDFYLVYSPERVLPGQILKELIENARVIGGINAISTQKGKELYSIFVKGDIVCTNSQTAEMVKLMENTYRDVNIAIANEFSRLANRFEVDVWEAIEIANLHPRVNILKPGPGVGGHCISVDPWFFVESAPDLTQLTQTAREVNDCQPEFVINQIERILGKLEGKRIGVLGLAYKPDVDDLRESPAISVVEKLLDAGSIVRVYEPFRNNILLNQVYIASTLEEAIIDSDLIIILVNHQQFRNIEPQKIIESVSCRLIFDVVGGLSSFAWEDFGFEYHRL
jgi:UDP-N-acetyl-D-mannosaminuronic acid dehydrogenase